MPKPVFKRKFDPNSERAIAGIEFQNKVQSELEGCETFQNVEDFRERARQIYYDGATDKKTESLLSRMEKEFGDITFTIEGQRFYVECCLAMNPKKSSMCEIKRTNFIGPNKWYCWGKLGSPEERVFIPSMVWQKYMGTLDLQTRNGWSFREIPIHRIGPSIRAAIIGTKNFELYIKTLCKNS